MHWRRGMPPYGPRGMPVMYPAMPMPPGTMPGPKQVTMQELNVSRVFLGCWIVGGDDLTAAVQDL